MKFDIAQQPFVPAFLTLAVLVVVALLRSTIPAAALPVDDALPTWLPAETLLKFQTAFPRWATTICGLSLLITGIRTGHFAVRYNLYSVNTCIAIPFYGIVACGAIASTVDLTACLCSLLLAFSISNFCRAFTPNYAFNILFRASLYLGAAVILIPQTAPLLLLLPLAVVHFHRTVRETIVALAGLLLAPLTLCYINWGLGAPFHAPLLALGKQLTGSGPFFALIDEIPLPTRFLLGALLVCLLFGFYFLFSSRLAVNSKPRVILYYNMEALLLSAAVLCLPGASLPLFSLTAVPAAVLLPLFFVRAYSSAGRAIYAILLAGVLLNILFK